MKKVQMKKFTNAQDGEINDFLNRIPAEDIVSTHFNVYGYQDASDEWAVIFYKTESGEV